MKVVVNDGRVGNGLSSESNPELFDLDYIGLDI